MRLKKFLFFNMLRSILKKTSELSTEFRHEENFTMIFSRNLCQMNGVYIGLDRGFLNLLGLKGYDPKIC